MNNFVENVNDYIRLHRIKKSYLIMATDWSKDRLYRILRGDKDNITYNEMQELADALHQSVSYFTENYDQSKNIVNVPEMAVAFYAGGGVESNEGELAYAKQVIELIDKMDALLNPGI